MNGIQWDNKCPYCGSEDYATFSFDRGLMADHYSCQGKCGREFHVQTHDDRVIMKETMQAQYINSYYVGIKRSLLKTARDEGVEANMPVCGNCVSYEWGKNNDDDFDRHYGSCIFQNDRVNFSLSDKFVKGKLHALINAVNCSNFVECFSDVETGDAKKVDRAGAALKGDSL